MIQPIPLLDFANQLPDWYKKYQWKGKYHSARGYPADEFATGFKWISHLEAKFANCNLLERDDLVEVAVWGGGQHGLADRIAKVDADLIRQQTKLAIDSLEDPSKALDHLLQIPCWGLTYASKTLRFLTPERFGSLDSQLRRGIEHLPAIWGLSQEIRRQKQISCYLEFLDVCGRVREKAQRLGIADPGNGSAGWEIAHVEMAMFSFIYKSNQRISI